MFLTMWKISCTLKLIDLHLYGHETLQTATKKYTNNPWKFPQVTLALISPEIPFDHHSFQPTTKQMFFLTRPRKGDFYIYERLYLRKHNSGQKAEKLHSYDRCYLLYKKYSRISWNFQRIFHSYLCRIFLEFIPNFENP